MSNLLGRNKERQHAMKKHWYQVMFALLNFTVFKNDNVSEFETG